MPDDFDKERLWRDVKKFVEDRINSNDKEMYTNSQKKRFWVKAVTNSYIRVEREKSKLPHEDIPRMDFIDIWTDLNKPKFISNGYAQKDLHGGQNRHTAVTFSIISKQDYIEPKKVGKGLKYFIKLTFIKNNHC